MRHMESCRLISFLGIMATFLMTSAPAAVCGETPEELYAAGKRHYESGRYLAAAERLFALLQIAGDGLDRPTRQSVMQALDYSEDQVQLSVETRRQLDATGQVVEVVVASEDPEDQSVQITQRKPFRSPPPRVRFKPMLPQSPQIRKPNDPFAAAGPAAGAAPAGQQRAVATSDNKSCESLEKRVALLIEGAQTGLSRPLPPAGKPPSSHRHPYGQRAHDGGIRWPGGVFPRARLPVQA